MPSTRQLVPVAALTLVLAFLPASRAQKKPQDAGHGPNFYSLQKESELGAALCKEVERSSRLLDDAFASEYLNRLAAQLADNSDSPFAITVRIIDSDVIDAFTLPGGYQYIDKGLILHTESKAELAAVLSRGIAFTAMRAETKETTKGEIMQLAAIPAEIFLPYGTVGSAAYEGMNLATPLTFLKFRRDAQLAADYYGIQYLYKSGYDSEAMPRFFERVWPLTAGSKPTPKAFNLDPPLADRLKAMRTEIQKLPARQQPAAATASSSSEYAALKERLEKSGPSPRKGQPVLQHPE